LEERDWTKDLKRERGKGVPKVRKRENFSSKSPFWKERKNNGEEGDSNLSET